MWKIACFVYKLTQNPLSFGKIRWHVMLSGVSFIADMATHILNVSLFLSNLCQNKSVCDTICLLLFYITISWKQNVYYQNGSVHIISFQWGSLKNIDYRK